MTELKKLKTTQIYLSGGVEWGFSWLFSYQVGKQKASTNSMRAFGMLTMKITRLEIG